MEAHPPSIIATSPDGKTRYLVLQTSDYLSRTLSEKGAFSDGLHWFCDALLKEYPPGLIIDVGCNLGAFSVPLAQAYPDHRFECFDVQRIILNHFHGSLALNGITNVRAHYAGLSDQTGVLDLPMPNYAQATNLGSYSLDQETNDYWKLNHGTTHVEQVCIETLDGFNYSDVRLIKIDVEGLEEKVLAGSVNTLARNHYPPIIVEAWTSDWFSKRRKALLLWLENCGYRMHRWGDDCIAQHPAYGAIVKF